MSGWRVSSRAMMATSVVVLALSASYSMITRAGWIGIVSLVFGFAAAALFGVAEGREQVLRVLRQAQVVPCVGGPMDGEAFPSPPAVFGTGATVTLVCDAHPEGSYHLEAGQFVWAEGDDE